jgi:hypothetical protein
MATAVSLVFKLGVWELFGVVHHKFRCYVHHSRSKIVIYPFIDVVLNRIPLHINYISACRGMRTEVFDFVGGDGDPVALADDNNESTVRFPAAGRETFVKLLYPLMLSKSR